MPEKNFLDDIDDDDIDMSIFDEEEDLPKEEPEEEPKPETVQVDDVVVNKETGEILEEVTNQAEAVMNNMDELGLTTDAKDFPEGHQFREDPAQSVEEEKGPEGPEEVTDEPEQAPAAKQQAPKGNAIQRAMSLLEYKHIKAMDPLFAQFEDCDFGVHTKEIKEAQAIIDMYYNDGWEVHSGRAEHDLGKLSALMARISGATGYLQGSGERFESVERAVRAGCYTELKEIKDKHGVRVSDKDADEVSRTIAAEYVSKYSKAPVVGRMVVHFWFAARRFIDILEGIVQRNYSGAKIEKHAEAAAHIEDPDAPTREPETTEDDGGFDF